jgi:hypothetical protein
MGAAMVAELLQFQALGGGFLVFRCGVVPVFTLRAFQSNNFSHGVLIRGSACAKERRSL